MPGRKTAARRADLKPEMPREGQTFAGESLWVRYANLVKLPHTLFALPFALVGTIYASRSSAVTARQVILIVVAFTAARFAAMGFNRIVDRALDALNPRTRNRELPKGRLTVAQATRAVLLAVVIFFLAAAMLNPLCFILSPLALVWILAYSYTKRFTSWSHLWLGASLAMAPVGGYLAIAGHWSTPAWTLHFLAAAVLAWVAGFDIFYALQDRDFDREHGLRSAVRLLGEARSIILAKSFHGISLGLLVTFGFGASLGWPFFAGLSISALILAWEHQLVSPADMSRLDVAFFTMNGVISLVVMAGMLADRLL
ncbi:MAG: 4-hydroxybenzoate octaprenyltransferase [Gemmatimonadetes bacterium]|nr:4-hydroxybenzoate octaprenyltransferase [Gemmatimonadota bacterium]